MKRGPGDQLVGGGDGSRVVVGDLGRQDPSSEGPRHDLGPLLVRALIPGIDRCVPGLQSAELEEPLAHRTRDVLVDPDVTHLVEQGPAGHLIHQDRAHVDPTGHRVAHVAAAPGWIVVELDLDCRWFQPSGLEALDGPSRQFELLLRGT